MSNLPRPLSPDNNEIETILDADNATGENGTGSPPDVDEIPPEEIPTYFLEHNGRLYHSHTTSPYPLPADTPEQERLNVQHYILNRVIGANYVGPVPDVLAPSPGRQKLVLDLCTGTGKWVLHMAREFPYVHFTGFDIVPIATRYPPNNVQFEIHDVNDGYRWRDGTFDFIHARSISMAVLNYSTVLNEIARVLRPGGLFLSCEWGRCAAFHPNLGVDPAEHAPAISYFFNTLNNALATARGIQPMAGSIPSYLADSGHFTQISPREIYVPIGPWDGDPVVQSLGRAFRAVHVRYADSVRPVLLQSGLSQGDVDEIIEAYIHELKTIRGGLVAVYHTVHARRL